MHYTAAVLFIGDCFAEQTIRINRNFMSAVVFYCLFYVKQVVVIKADGIHKFNALSVLPNQRNRRTWRQFLITGNRPQCVFIWE